MSARRAILKTLFAEKIVNCRTCGAECVWHKSTKGKWYLCNWSKLGTPADGFAYSSSDVHKCGGQA